MCNRESLAGSGFILEAAQSKLPGTMGYQDRDWYKDAQRDRPPVARKPAPPKRKGPVFSYILLWVVIGLVFYGLVTTFIPGMGSSRVQILRDGSVVLGTNRTGNYVINGSINGVSVRFVVDTGASLTSVSQRVARHMGLFGCVPARFTTANGEAQVCVAGARDLQFGDFRVQNVQVAVMPDMETQALLGMNVLNRFHITQNGGKMIISKPAP
jgi:aspartyl protease family protein